MPTPRFELKFPISETTADAVRDYARAYVVPDRYADPVTYSYPIDSLYLDSDDLSTFWHAMNGARRRYKLRVRTYDDRPTSPVFFEIKRCIDEQIVKERGAVRRSAVEKILNGYLPEREELISKDPEHLLTIENFIRLSSQIEAKPKAFVRYIREAWVGTDDPELRFTMDREVGVRPKTTTEITQADREAESVRPFGGTVILEVKFSGRMPHWFPDLARVAGMRISPAAKYCQGLMLHGLNEFSPVDWPVYDPARLLAPEAAPVRQRQEAPLPFLQEIGLRALTRSAAFEKNAA